MRRAKVWTEKDFEVKESTIPGAGLGLFSKVNIELEDTIGYYTGEIVNWADLPVSGFSGSNYIMALTNTLLLVGEGPKANYTRYINHSDKPNGFLIVSTRWKTARIEAIDSIKPGEEIFFNYGEDYWSV